MEKTIYYQLNKPEVTDPLRVADFNENANIIDAVLAGKAEKSAVTAVETALDNKANAADLTSLSQTVNALSTTVNSKGNCRIAQGTYVGTGKVGASNPNSLNFGFYPLMVWISGTSTGSSWLRNGGTTRYNTSGGYEFIMTWNDTGVKWYHDSIYYASQFNTAGETYYYYAIGI